MNLVAPLRPLLPSSLKNYFSESVVKYPREKTPLTPGVEC